ncbi:hypothetical protein FoTM2_017741 [Fusarium oxysporum f. sp. vasinfectum]|uniref:Uncharacterized protein n=1 Tax=Fusarium oxysporum f. sp. vasinfectum 25433 TaxID=1089449 RepID=X0L7C0_FUSOX|nr:hypothetical protein FOTG_14906 [Fusarium oxysporum f. sp. vasinfectum 25433]KAK2922385.1 hypothetical protein FoTM2_017741 [Fusarium oxysporum f. sp. vasinfectum]
MRVRRALEDFVHVIQDFVHFVLDLGIIVHVDEFLVIQFCQAWHIFFVLGAFDDALGAPWEQGDVDRDWVSFESSESELLSIVLLHRFHAS